jgi:hypothetical protein
MAKMVQFLTALLLTAASQQWPGDSTIVKFPKNKPNHKPLIMSRKQLRPYGELSSTSTSVPGHIISLKNQPRMIKHYFVFQMQPKSDGVVHPNK